MVAGITDELQHHADRILNVEIVTGQVKAECRTGIVETRLPRRFLRTYSQGLTHDGYFLDCWPGYDRLARLSQRALDMTNWGPLLDHGVQFVFDCYYHYMQTGDSAALQEPHATAVLFDQISLDERSVTIDELNQCPASMGFSYPANACWRLWALMHAGRAQEVIDDLRSRCYPLASVHENNSLQEDWVARPDTCSQWSHSPVSPILMVHGDIAGIKATAPGYKKVTIRPQLGDISSLSLVNHTPLGPIVFESVKEGDGQRVSIAIPFGCEAELIVQSGCTLNLKMVEDDGKLVRYCLPVGESATFDIMVDKSRN